MEWQTATLVSRYVGIGLKPKKKPQKISRPPPSPAEPTTAAVGVTSFLFSYQLTNSIILPQTGQSDALSW